MSFELGDFEIIVDSIILLVQCSEEKNAQEKIREKLKELNKVEYIQNSSIQKEFVRRIVKLESIKKKIQAKTSTSVIENNIMWEALIDEINNIIIITKKQKRTHAILNKN